MCQRLYICVVLLCVAALLTGCGPEWRRAQGVWIRNGETIEIREDGAVLVNGESSDKRSFAWGCGAAGCDYSFDEERDHSWRVSVLNDERRDVEEVARVHFNGEFTEMTVRRYRDGAVWVYRRAP